MDFVNQKLSESQLGVLRWESSEGDPAIQERRLTIVEVASRRGDYGKRQLGLAGL